MAKEEKGKKKPGIVKRIFKWIGLGLLSLLLIAALIFQAPWKVTALLVVILLACTILPKAYRKWFWLSVAAVVIALITWVFLPDRKGDWKPYTFDEELAALEAKRAIPDSENAAIIYNQLLKIEILDGNEPEFFAQSTPASISGPWLAKDHPEMAEWLQQQESKIATLLLATKKEKCRFPVNADFINISQTMDRLPSMRQCAYLLICAGNNDIGEGRIGAGLEKYLCVIQMAKHQRQQPALIDFLVGVALEALSINRFKRFVVTGDATEEYLRVIEETLTEIKHDWGYDLPKFIGHDKLMAKSLLSMFYGVSPEGKIKLNPGMASRAMMTQLPEDMKDEIALKYWLRKLMKATTIWAWFYMPSTPQKASKIIDASYEKLYAMAEPDFDWDKQPAKPSRWIKLNFRYLTEHLAGILEPPYHRIHDTYLRVVAEQRGSRLIIALRRYKNKNAVWPERLDDIKSFAPAEIFVDPINGDSFVYKLTEENFTLYSKGKNNIDENGQYNTKWAPDYSWHKVEEDDWLIWPPRSCKTKEEKTDAE
ncbi:hypothetical protein ES703_68803 [subsurface metagenome]